VVGGNVTRAPGLALSVTVCGAVPAGTALRRAGARPGHAIMVSGTLGEAALGLRPGASARLTRRQRRPEPRLALGWALRGIASAAIDLSDGLVQDLGHLCLASGVGASLRLAELPLSPAYLRATAGLADPFAPALSGGEDYELCLTVPLGRVRQALAVARRVGTPLAVIGTVTRQPGVQVARPHGGHHPVARGHDHLGTVRRLAREAP
jgi:thiamine-monophosphate kinase